MANTRTGRYEIAPLFDFGMGLFESDTWFRDMEDFHDCLRYCYIEPYSEDPLVLYDELDAVFHVSDILVSRYRELLTIREALFPSEKAYRYYLYILDRAVNGYFA